MKKIVLSLIICLIFISGAQAGTTAPIDLSKNLRVGLKQLYENVDAITINNSSLVLGYQIDGNWLAEYEMNSTTGYSISPATHIYLISTQTFNTYEESYIKVTLLREQGYMAYSGSVSPGIWKVYIGSFPTDMEANNTKTNLQATSDFTYETVTDNGLRTQLSYEGSYPIILENSYAQACFGTKDVLNGMNIINLSKRSYRGKMEIGRYNKQGVTAVNVVKLEEYLYGVVPAEMISTWPMEALKAQAVAARNYAVRHAITGTKYSGAYSICDTINSQVYKGFGSETTTCNQAVNETYGKLIYFGEMIITANFFSTSGGHTEDGLNVWSGSVPYLKGVPDIYETQPETKPWVQSFTSTEIEGFLTNNNVNIGSVTDVQVVSYSDAGRAMSLRITGTMGSHDIPKETMRVWLPLKSRKFTLVKGTDVPQQSFSVLGSGGVTGTLKYEQLYVINGYNNITQIPKGDQLIIFSGYNIYNLPMMNGVNGTYIFVGEGHGHGAGLSQSGAKGMAMQGFTYQQILEYYFTGTTVK